MLYKFQSRATADLLMLGPAGDHILRLVGREPAPQGIFEVKDLPQLMQRLAEAIEEEERARAEAEAQAEAEGQTLPPPDVTLRQRVWPLKEMMRRSLAENHPIVWGV